MFINTKKKEILNKSEQNLENYGKLIFHSESVAMFYLSLFNSKEIVLKLKEVKDLKKFNVMLNHMKKGTVIVEKPSTELLNILKKNNIKLNQSFNKKNNPFTPVARKSISNEGVLLLSNFYYKDKKFKIKNGKKKGLKIYKDNNEEEIEVYYDGMKFKIIDYDIEGVKDLYDVKKIYFFINEPSKGGIISQIKNYIIKLKLENKYQIYLIYGDDSNLDNKYKFDLSTLGIKNINAKNVTYKEIGSDNLLIFTQIGIALQFSNLFNNNNVIIQYHRNLSKITTSNLNHLKNLSKLMKYGYVQLLASQEEIDEKMGNNNKFISFKNYIEGSGSVLDEKVNSVKKIVYVGRISDLDKSKNIEGLINIIRSIPNHIKIYIYGSGERVDEIKKLGNNVIYKGFEYDKSKIYKNKDLLILPSLEEAFPLVILEAASYGVKSLTYNNSSLVKKEITDEIGYVVKLNDEKEFIQKIVNLPKYNRKNVIDYFEKNFNINKIPKLRLHSQEYNNTINNFNTYIYKQSINNNKLEIGLFFQGYKKSNDEVYINSTFSYTFKENNDYEYYSRLSVNFPENFLTICIDLEYVSPYEYLEIYHGNQKSRLITVRDTVKDLKISDDIFISISEKNIHTRLKENNLKNAIENFNEKRNIFIFQDRKEKADDNAEYMYEYYKKQGKKEIYYILNRNSKDFERLLRKGFNIVYSDTYKYIYLFLKSSIIYTSHLKKEIMFPKMENYFYQFKKSKNVFLQHGVIFAKSDYKYFLNTLQNKVDLFITSSKYEKKLIETFSDYDNIKVTGLARWDRFHKEPNETKNEILYFPTWNRNMMNVDDFTQTNYFKTIIDLIENKDLEKLLEKNNIEIILVLHQEFEKYTKLFVNKTTNKKLKIKYLSNVHLGKMIEEAKVLITDVSSIRYDFSIQKKNTICFYDYEIHSENDLGEINDFSYKAKTPKEVIKILENIISNNYKIDSKTSQKIDYFFDNIDSNNCERIHNEAIKLLKE